MDKTGYESMFGEYSPKNIHTLLFNSYFMGRRIVYALIIVFLPDYPVAQVFCFLMICIPIFCLHVVLNPYLSIIYNIIMNINEAMFLVIGSAFFAFAEPSNNQEKVDLLGSVVMMIIMTVISLNIFVLTYMKIKLVSKVSFLYDYFFILNRNYYNSTKATAKKRKVQYRYIIFLMALEN